MNRRPLPAAGLLALALALVAGLGASLALARPEPELAPHQTANRKAPKSACTALITETVAPRQVRLCETADVSVTLAVTCPTSLPVHLIVVIDRSGSMRDFLRDVQRSARAVLDQIDFGVTPGTKVGVLSHGFRVTTETDLTEEASRAFGAINNVRYISSDVGEDPARAIEIAQQMLEAERDEDLSPIEAILLYGDGCEVAGCDGKAQRAASIAKASDIEVLAVCYENERSNCPTYRNLVTSPSYYFEGSAARLPRTIDDLAKEGEELEVAVLELLEELTPSLSYVAGSGAPAPRANGQALTFTWRDVLPGDTVTATYRLEVSEIGASPVRTDSSSATIIDSLSRGADPVAVPTGQLEVTGPCVPPTDTPQPSPTSPTATPTLEPTETPEVTPTPVEPTATATAEATPTPKTTWLHLPLLLRHVCQRVEQHTDVVLAIDASVSMLEQDGAVTKLQAAQLAAAAFLEFLADGDQAAILAFNAQARLVEPLTDERTALEAALSAIEAAPGTRIDLALERANEELASARSLPGNNRVIVLLTDGRPTTGTEESALAAAATAKAASVTIETIGLGANVDGDLLRAIASTPDLYFEAPDAGELAQVYERVAGTLPCPGGVFWP